MSTETQPSSIDNDSHKNFLSQFLGEKVADLPEIVQKSHAGSICLAGRVSVERGKGLGGIIASFMRFPESTSDCPFHVIGHHGPDWMSWRRVFGDKKSFCSFFSRSGGFLVEKSGVLSLRLKADVQNCRLVYQLHGASFLGVPLPRPIWPRLTAWEDEKYGLCDFEVIVALPGIGQVIRYAGTLALATKLEQIPLRDLERFIAEQQTVEGL